MAYPPLLKETLIESQSLRNENNMNTKVNMWLNRFSKKNPSVACTLVGRKMSSVDGNLQLALCDVSWRPFRQWFSRSDLAMSMVRHGRALPAAPSSDLVVDGMSYDLYVDQSRDAAHVESDVELMKLLNEAEGEARREKLGYWEGGDAIEEDDCEGDGLISRVVAWFRNRGA